MIFKSFLPPVILIFMIKGSILFGIATPSEAGAVGAFGTLILAIFNRRLTFELLQGVCHTSARTIAMIFFIIVAAGVFNSFLSSAKVPQTLAEFFIASDLNPWIILLGMLLLYLPACCCVSVPRRSTVPPVKVFPLQMTRPHGRPAATDDYRHANAHGHGDIHTHNNK